MHTHTYRFFAVKLRCEQQQSKQCSLFFSLVFCDIIIFSWWEKRDCMHVSWRGFVHFYTTFYFKEANLRYAIAVVDWYPLPSKVVIRSIAGNEARNKPKIVLEFYPTEDEFTLDGWTDIFGILRSFLLSDDYANLRDRFCPILLCWSAADGDEMRE